MAKVQYKIYRSPHSFGSNPVFYGLVLNQSLSAEESLRQIMAEKKITAFQPSQLVTLIDSVLQGAIELTARDGIPRSVSSLLRTHLAWDRGFDSIDSSPKSVPMSVRVRLLKDLRLPVDMSSLEFIPAAGVLIPKIERVFAAGTSLGNSGKVSLSHNIVLQGERLDGDSAQSMTFGGARLVTFTADDVETESTLTTVEPASWYRREFSWDEGTQTAAVGEKGFIELSYNYTTPAGGIQEVIITKDVEIIA